MKTYHELDRFVTAAADVGEATGILAEIANGDTVGERILQKYEAACYTKFQRVFYDTVTYVFGEETETEEIAYFFSERFPQHTLGYTVAGGVEELICPDDDEAEDSAAVGR